MTTLRELATAGRHRVEALTRRWRPALPRFILLAILAASYATVLSARVSVNFERVRIRAVEADLFSSRGTVAVPLPDMADLSGQAVAIVARLRNSDPNPRVVRIALEGSELATVALAPAQQVRLDLSVPASANLSEGDQFTLSSGGDGWALSYLELANVHGFSTGPLALVIVPASAEREASLPPLVPLVLFIALLILPASSPRPPRRKAARVTHAVMATLVLAFLAAVLVTSWVSQYELLLSTSTFMLCVGIVYYPALWQVSEALVRLIVRNRVRLLYVLAVALFLVSMAGYYEPDNGFTSLIRFGDQFEDRALPAVRSTAHHVLENSSGYDGQFYAQLAIDPLLRDPAIDGALDTVSYRARRILFSWTAFLAGLGQPRMILQAYAVQNIAFWLVLGMLLFRWLPPRTVKNFCLWFGCMFSYGALFSVSWAVPDGPSILLLALAIMAAESGRPLVAAGLVGFSGLAKETNLLWIVVLGGPGSEWRRWKLGVLGGQVVLVASPLLLWMLYVWMTSQEFHLLGSDRNFSAPLSGYLAKWTGTLAELREEGWASFARFSLLGLIAMTTQALVLLIYRDWENPWWRAGIASVLLMVFLGPSPWEGHPGAVLRILLPMTFAFNLLLPRTAWFWPLFVMGNLTVWPALETIRVPFLWYYL